MELELKGNKVYHQILFIMKTIILNKKDKKFNFQKMNNK